MIATIPVNIIPLKGHEIYEPRYLSITPGRVIGCGNSRNLSFYLGYCSREEYEERVIPIRNAMDNYNSIVRTLWEIPGFREFFADNNSVVSKDTICKQYGNEVANLAFSLKSPPNCYPDLIVTNGMFQLCNAGYQGRIEYNNVEYCFDIDGIANSYPDVIDGKICFWNWNENGTDYALQYAHYVEEQLPNGIKICTDPLDMFDVYDQWRGEVIPIVEAINEVFTSMEKRGYLQKYLLKANNYQSVWNYYTGLTDNTVGLYLCDPKAFKDKLLVARINALMNACLIKYNGDDTPDYGALIDEETEQLSLSIPHYYLQDISDKTFLSREPGALGGHYKLKIYGRLDCPSAARYISKGQYIRNRVFFKDEATAIAAGYRPCGVCMKEAYTLWKDKKKEKKGYD